MLTNSEHVELSNQFITHTAEAGLTRADVIIYFPSAPSYEGFVSEPVNLKPEIRMPNRYVFVFLVSIRPAVMVSEIPLLNWLPSCLLDKPADALASQKTTPSATSRNPHQLSNQSATPPTTAYQSAALPTNQSVSSAPTPSPCLGVENRIVADPAHCTKFLYCHNSTEMVGHACQCGQMFAAGSNQCQPCTLEACNECQLTCG